jgi:hypothetical protein
LRSYLPHLLARKTLRQAPPGSRVEHVRVYVQFDTADLPYGRHGVPESTPEYSTIPASHSFLRPLGNSGDNPVY